MLIGLGVGALGFAWVYLSPCGRGRPEGSGEGFAEVSNQVPVIRKNVAAAFLIADN